MITMSEHKLEQPVSIFDIISSLMSEIEGEKKRPVEINIDGDIQKINVTSLNLAVGNTIGSGVHFLIVEGVTDDENHFKMEMHHETNTIQKLIIDDM